MVPFSSPSPLAANHNAQPRLSSNTDARGWIRSATTSARSASNLSLLTSIWHTAHKLHTDSIPKISDFRQVYGSDTPLNSSVIIKVESQTSEYWL
jgi:hypothetical protein